MPHLPAPTHEATTHRTRAAGVAIATATIVSTLFVAMDQSAGGHSPLEILQGIAKL